MEYKPSVPFSIIASIFINLCFYLKFKSSEIWVLTGKRAAGIKSPPSL
nr:MAG TPA: hypothetical protein [Caudoviricetes sp.]